VLDSAERLLANVPGRVPARLERRDPGGCSGNAAPGRGQSPRELEVRFAHRSLRMAVHREARWDLRFSSNGHAFCRQAAHRCEGAVHGSIMYSGDNCKVFFERSCPSPNGLRVTRGTALWSDDATQGHSREDVVVSAEDGSIVCSSSYDVIVERR
jgi:hypothetical protein